MVLPFFITLLLSWFEKYLIVAGFSSCQLFHCTKGHLPFFFFILQIMVLYDNVTFCSVNQTKKNIQKHFHRYASFDYCIFVWYVRYHKVMHEFSGKNKPNGQRKIRNKFIDKKKRILKRSHSCLPRFSNKMLFFGGGGNNNPSCLVLYTNRKIIVLKRISLALYVCM